MDSTNAVTHQDYGNIKTIIFTFVFENFVIQYTDKCNADFLINILSNNYEVILIDWAASIYCGVTLNWDYNKKICVFSIPGYIKGTLQQFNHPTPSKLQHSPHCFDPS